MLRRTFSFLFIAIALGSCSKDYLSGTGQFTAVFDDENATKVSFLDSDLCWMSGDMVAVFSSPVEEQYRFDGADYSVRGTFSKVEGSAAPGGTAFGKHYAFSPYSKDIVCREEGNFTVPVPSVQYYSEGKYGNAANILLASRTKDINDRNLRFGMVQGLLSFSIASLSGFPIKEIVLEGNNGEILSGDAGVTFDGSGKPIVSLPQEGRKAITLDCSGNNKSNTGYVDFCMSVLPITFEKGFTITVKDSSGETYTKSTSKSVTVARNTLSSMKRFCLQGGSEKPLIGLTHYKDGKNDTPYHLAIIQAGGIPVNFMPISTEEEALAQIGMVDGILIPGSTVTEYDYADITLPKLAVQSKKWVMGICHGCQFINLAMGGTRDNTSSFSGALKHKEIEYYSVAHSIKINHDSRLYEILGTDELEVNSRHNMCVRKPAPNVKIVAYCKEDGVIPEAIEGDYIIGYQFHPEAWAKDGTRPYLNLFEDYIEKVKSTMQ